MSMGAMAMGAAASGYGMVSGPPGVLAPNAISRPQPQPDTVTARLEVAAFNLIEAHAALAAIEAVITGPMPEAADKRTQAPILGLNALSSDLASSSSILVERLRAVLAGLKQ